MVWIDTAYAVFHKDFIASTPTLDGQRVACRRRPVCSGKEVGFWHCISEGSIELDRTPDPDRCERIGWVRAVIENATDPLVDRWENERSGDRRLLLWYAEAFLVVLASRRTYLQLVTSSPTDLEHRKRKLRRERDAWRELQKKLMPPP